MDQAVARRRGRGIHCFDAAGKPDGNDPDWTLACHCCRCPAVEASGLGDANFCVLDAALSPEACVARRQARAGVPSSRALLAGPTGHR